MIRPMPRAATRWIIYAVAVLAFGPLAGGLTAWLRSPDGGGDATPFVSTAPALGVAAALAALGIALFVGVIAARLVGARSGMSAAGLVLAWAAWRTGTIDQIIRGNGSGGVLWRLAVEGAILGLAVIVIAYVLEAVGRGGGADAEPGRAGSAALPARDALSLRAMVGPAAAGLIAGGVAAWFIAQTPLKGQAVAAAIVGSMCAAAAGRLIDPRAALATLALPITLLAILGPLTGMVMGATPSLLIAGRNGTLFPLANILPLDWIAGGLLGIPLGVSWAASLIEKRTDGRR